MKSSDSLIRILAVFVLTFAALVPMNAELIVGRLLDTDTKQPVEEAEITAYCKVTYEGLATSVTVSTAKSDSTGFFQIKVGDGHVTMEINCIGYHTVKRTFYGSSSGDTLRLGDIPMKYSDVLLKYVTVKGRMKRFYMCGDTVVFNPKAFHLQEGARMGELVKKLDGVRVEDGKLTWMGKPLRLLVDGEELFGDNTLLMSRLPAEAVDKIKAYNKASESSRRTGLDDGRQDRVLDIKIKPSWLDRWYADTEAGIQNKARYVGTLDAFRLSKTDPMMLFLKANNVNEGTFENSFGSKSWGGIGNFGKEQFGSVGYKHQWVSKFDKNRPKNNFSVNFEGGHDDGLWNNHNNSETYLPGTTHTYTLTGSDSRNISWKPQFKLRWHLDLDSMTSFTLMAGMNYSKKKINGTYSSATFSQSPYEFDSAPLNNALYAPSEILKAHLINSRSEHSLGDYEGGGIDLNPWIRRYFKDRSSVTFSDKFNYHHSRELSFLHRDVNYDDASALNSFNNIYSRTPVSDLVNTASLGYERWIITKVLLKANYSFGYSHNYNRTDYYRLDHLTGYDTVTASELGDRPWQGDSLAKALDAANSPLQRTNSYSHQWELSSTLNLKPFTLMPSIVWKMNHETLDYQRGHIDTAAVRNTSALSPSLMVRMKIDKMSTLEANYDHHTYFPELLSTIGYRDDTDPLNVREGNTGLHTYYDYHVNVNFRTNIMKGEQSLMVSVDYLKNIATPNNVFYYNAKTGAYRSHQENLQGGDNWKFSANYERALFAGTHVRNDFKYNFGTNYGLLAVVAEGARPELNHQRCNNYLDNLSLTGTFGNFELSLPAKFQYQGFRNSLGATKSINLYDYQVGVSGQYNLGLFSFSSDFTMYKRSGYLTGEMNRTLPIWNASADWKILKSKGKLAINLNDILNKNTNYFSNQTQTSRMETWSTTLHNYVRITFTYHFDAKVKEEE